MNELSPILSKQVPLLHSQLFQFPPSSPSSRAAGRAGEEILGQTLCSSFSSWVFFFGFSPRGLGNNSLAWKGKVDAVTVGVADVVCVVWLSSMVVLCAVLGSLMPRGVLLPVSAAQIYPGATKSPA